MANNVGTIPVSTGTQTSFGTLSAWVALTQVNTFAQAANQIGATGTLVFAQYVNAACDNYIPLFNLTVNGSSQGALASVMSAVGSTATSAQCPTVVAATQYVYPSLAQPVISGITGANGQSTPAIVNGSGAPGCSSFACTGGIEFQILGSFPRLSVSQNAPVETDVTLTCGTMIFSTTGGDMTVASASSSMIDVQLVPKSVPTAGQSYSNNCSVSVEVGFWESGAVSASTLPMAALTPTLPGGGGNSATVSISLTAVDAASQVALPSTSAGAVGAYVGEQIKYAWSTSGLYNVQSFYYANGQSLCAGDYTLADAKAVPPVTIPWINAVAQPLCDNGAACANSVVGTVQSCQSGIQYTVGIKGIDSNGLPHSQQVTIAVGNPPSATPSIQTFTGTSGSSTAASITVQVGAPYSLNFVAQNATQVIICETTHGTCSTVSNSAATIATFSGSLGNQTATAAGTLSYIVTPYNGNTIGATSTSPVQVVVTPAPSPSPTPSSSPAQNAPVITAFTIQGSGVSAPYGLPVAVLANTSVTFNFSATGTNLSYLICPPSNSSSSNQGCKAGIGLTNPSNIVGANLYIATGMDGNFTLYVSNQPLSTPASCLPASCSQKSIALSVRAVFTSFQATADGATVGSGGTLNAKAGDPMTFSWATTDAANIMISHGLNEVATNQDGTFAASGQTTVVLPSTPGTYYYAAIPLQSSNEGQYESILVVVTAPNAPTVKPVAVSAFTGTYGQSNSATLLSLPLGGQVSFAWTLANATASTSSMLMEDDSNGAGWYPVPGCSVTGTTGHCNVTPTYIGGPWYQVVAGTASSGGLQLAVNAAKSPDASLGLLTISAAGSGSTGGCTAGWITGTNIPANPYDIQITIEDDWDGSMHTVVASTSTGGTSFTFAIPNVTTSTSTGANGTNPGGTGTLQGDFAKYGLMFYVTNTANGLPNALSSPAQASTGIIKCTAQ